MSEPTTPVWNRENPYHATLVDSHPLTSANAVREVRHFEFDLGESQLCYQPGDTISLLIHNDPVLVQAILSTCGLRDDAELAQQLETQYELTQVHPGFIRHYSGFCSDPKLHALQSDGKALRQYLEHRPILAVLREFPTELNAEQLRKCLRQLQPRQYSIASSQRQSPTRVALTIGILRFAFNAQQHAGAGSSYLADRVHVGQRVPLYFNDNPSFRLPTDPTTPIIMIGPGTGIAPFRAFLQERTATPSAGRNWLFCGNRQRAHDFLYDDELLRYQQQGLLTRLELAFSREQAQKVYVQDLLQQQGAEVFAWLEQGAHIYVCGDAKHMAEDVQKTLLALIAEHGKLDDTAAREYLVQLRQQQRYQRDVY